jgi:subtilisin-like proprotein convertase family protein
VQSTITVSGCAGNAASDSTVEVHIVHSYVGDLVVTLVTPGGRTYPLRNRTGGGSDNIDETYTVDLDREVANGTWTLRVRDSASGDTGHVDRWTLNL